MTGNFQRPQNVVELLSEDVTYPGWETDSAGQPRFYVRGITWGLRACRTHNVSDFRDHFPDGVKIVLDETDWSDQLTAQAQDKKTYDSGWKEVPAYNQALRGVHRRLPVVFFKAVQLLAIFEAKIRSSGNESVDPLEVYHRMHIEPATFNVDRFNVERLAELRALDKGFDGKILAHCEQIEPDLLDDVARGQTVTRGTAEKICDYVNNHTEIEDEVGPVRFTPGRKKLGKGRASDNEVVIRNSSQPVNGASESSS